MIDIEKMFKEIGVIKEGHFLLHSGLHSGIYFEKFRLIEHPEYAIPLFELLASQFEGEPIDTVAGPTTGGSIIAFEVARVLRKRCIIAEKVEGGRDFLRGFGLKPDENILVVDDVLTTGASVKDVISAIKRYNANPYAVGVLIDRSNEIPDFGIPLYSVYRKRVENFNPEDCPLCKLGVPLTKPGGV
ncbi:orotate phosphoribosyltransferase [candidate division WOR-3 bacterium JGI_Cruoil_03_44_89]|uniref:Orotate phosphoribosyltransferase n=1 Tax=candidate division WOR-3 bacterium JGI_Cruoil_03_44_89 TaxID=1973748 RepID=A0A235BYK4_UNCW3|nr:MAG: orotate phosphoribosyltransferase [candidate division WOR-3 bacterium JGI_Cruoil_03_44_89]